MSAFKPFTFEFDWSKYFPGEVGMFPEVITVTNAFHLHNTSGFKDGKSDAEIGLTVYLKNCFHPDTVYMQHINEVMEENDFVGEVYAQLMVRGACVSNRFRDLQVIVDKKFGKGIGDYVAGRDRLLHLWDVVYDYSQDSEKTKIQDCPEFIATLVDLGVDFSRGGDGTLFLHVPYGYQSGWSTTRFAASITVGSFLNVLHTFIENSEKSSAYTFEDPFKLFTKAHIKRALFDGMLFTVFISGDEYKDLTEVAKYIDTIVRRGPSDIAEEVVSIGDQLLFEDYHSMIPQIDRHHIDNHALEVKEKLEKYGQST